VLRQTQPLLPRIEVSGCEMFYPIPRRTVEFCYHLQEMVILRAWHQSEVSIVESISLAMESNKPNITRKSAEMIVEIVTWSTLLLLLWVG
jgi:hypothetical protein